METSAELPPVSSTRIAMSVGAVTAALMLVVSAFGWQVVNWIVFLAGIYWGMKRFKNELGGIIVYFRALSAGFQTAFFASLIMAFFSYVSATLEPSLIDATLATVEQQLKTYSVSSALVEESVQQWREMLSPMVIAAITIFSYSTIGGLLSIVFAFFVRNAKPGEFVEY